MKCKVINDLHCYSSYQMMTPDEFRAELLTTPSTTLLIDLEDNIDLRNCKHEDVGAARSALYDAQRITAQKNGIFVRGNHNLNQIAGDDFKIVQGDKIKALFTHGDWLFWTQQKCKEFRSKDPGCGWLKRLFYNSFTDGVYHFLNRKISEQFLDNLEYYARLYDVTDVYCGHMHCPETITGTYKGVNYTVFKRGINEIEI